MDICPHNTLFCLVWSTCSNWEGVNEDGYDVYSHYPCEDWTFAEIPTTAPSFAHQVGGGVCGTESAGWIMAETPALGEVSEYKAHI